MVQGGGDSAWAHAFFGSQTKGRGGTEAASGDRAGAPPPHERCPQCGGRLQTLPGPALPTRVPTEMVACAGCGFFALRELPPG